MAQKKIIEPEKWLARCVLKKYRCLKQRVSKQPIISSTTAVSNATINGKNKKSKPFRQKKAD